VPIELLEEQSRNTSRWIPSGGPGGS
jgi:hypothetical protein